MYKRQLPEGGELVRWDTILYVFIIKNIDYLLILNTVSLFFRWESKGLNTQKKGEKRARGQQN